MRQQLECEVARPGYEAGAMQGLALGDGNVRGASPVSLGLEETMTIHTVCVIHSAKGGVRIICERQLANTERGHRLGTAVDTCEIHLHPVESTYMPPLFYYQISALRAA